MTRRPKGPSLVVVFGRGAIRRVRPKIDRSLDLRLIAPVILSWPVLAFWGLVAPLPLAGVGALASLAFAGVGALLASRRRC